MKYLLPGLFNLAAIYVLFVFVLGNGGIIDSAKKMEMVNSLEDRKVESGRELESLKNRLSYFRSLTGPDSESLVRQGRKTGNMVIFKFIDTPSVSTERVSGLKNRKEGESLTIYRIYFSIGFVVISILLGNILIFRRMDSRQGYGKRAAS